jgi:hypothetical protein
VRVNVAFDTAPAGMAAMLAADTDAEKRRITGLAVPFGVPSGPSSDGHRYQFAGPPENADELIDVVDEHNDDVVVGRLSEPFVNDDTGALADTRIFNTTAGNDVLTLTHEGVKTGFSIAASFDEFEERGDVRHVGAWTALHLGVVRRPAFTQASGLTLAASAQKEDTMTATVTEPATAPAVVELPTVAELAAQVAEHMKETRDSGTHPLARFRSRDQFLAAFVAGDEETRARMAIEFAVADQVTTDNPGVIPPGWRTAIKANIDRRRPAVTAFGTIGLPDAGMDANWPYLDPALDIDTLVAQQAAEKDELSSVKIKILKATEGIKTAGVASDISYQLLMRSSPSYLAAFQTICEAAWARYTEAKFEAKLLASATDSGTLPLDLTNAAGAASFRSLLFDASAAVEDATGAPADIVLASPSVWTDLGGNDAFKSAEYGTSNVPGTASAATLRININGLEVKRAPFFTGTQVLVSNAETAKFAESGPLVATQENVTKLGRDVAVWGMYEDGEVYFPAGLALYDAD